MRWRELLNFSSTEVTPAAHKAVEHSLDPHCPERRGVGVDAARSFPRRAPTTASTAPAAFCGVNAHVDVRLNRTSNIAEVDFEH